MANKNSNSSLSQNTFNGSMSKDDSFFGMKEGDYIMARNAINKSSKGDRLTRITEPSNKICSYAPYVIIGARNLENDWWVVFSTNNSISEIGYFYANKCEYKKLARGSCLGFKTTHLITAVSRPTYDGSYNVYFDDSGLNVSRKFNTRVFPFIQNCVTIDGCTTCEDTEVIDCDKLRLESYVQQPCLSLQKGPSIGTLLNGSYTAFIAYLINGQRVTDYIGKSNILSIFSHENINSSIELDLSNLDQTFEDYELVITSVISEKTVARNIGVYSTSQNKITLDFIDNDLPIVNLSDLPIITPVPDKSEGMYEVEKYLTRVNPTNKFEFNYQPLANQIKALWQSVEYPKDYYKKGGANVGYMRDENVALFIRFRYNTGDKTVSWHIPGRAAKFYTITNDSGVAGATLLENALCPATSNDIESPSYTPKVFEVYNTANITSAPNTVLPDGGIVIAEGEMGYWESTELYDSNNAAVWNSNILGRPEFDLCGKPIRHHKFPDNVIVNSGGVNYSANHYGNDGNTIRILGLKLENIQPPVDNNGNLIPGIVGYEILRGSRNGDKTVLFKGMINNMFEYDVPKSITNRKGLYANYPFNDLRPDKFISKGVDPVTYEPAQGGLQNYDPNDQVSLKNFTFHSPDTTFAKPFLEADELKTYSIIYGQSRGSYVEPDQHPRHKFITDISFIGSIVVGFGYAIAKMNGTRDVVYPGYIIDSDPIFAGTSTSVGNIGSAAALVALGTAAAAANNTLSVQGVVDALTGNNSGLASLVQGTKTGVIAAGLSSAAVPSSGVTQQSITITYKDQEQSPGILKSALLALGNPMFLGHLSDGADSFIKLIQSVGSWQQYAVQYQSYCGYEKTYFPIANNRRRAINTARYLDPGNQDFENNYIINHKFRNETVVFSTKTDVVSISGSLADVSRPELMSELPANKQFENYLRRASSHYVAFKSRNRNQYGQLNQIVQILATVCCVDISNSTSPVIFGGDTYIGKYSEKNTLYYFDKWLQGEPDGAKFNYFLHRMFEHTAFWMDTDPFDLMEFSQSIPTALSSAISSGSVSTFFSTLVTPSDKHCFDRLPGYNGIFLLKKVFMYLFQSGIRDFFVESEYNIDYRDWEDSDDKKHWPVLSDLKTMFSMENIKADNYYKIDRSLSVSFLAQNKINWSDLQQRDYNPLLAETVFTKRKRRLLYSLPQEQSAKKDNFSVFLPLNYKDYTSDITCIKPLNKGEALILFKTEPPGLLPGVDELKTTNGTKLTIGDGTLFSREMQRLDNSELSFQHGSCQNRLSVINTPVGVFYMSVNQGEIFLTDGRSLKPISDKRLRRWLNLFLPYQLIKEFPDFELIDNPVTGIGCQSAFSPDTGIAYFCKKDYVLKKGYTANENVIYLRDNLFRVNGLLEVKLGDPRVFENASWTLSWDVFEDALISFHDWHPDLILLSDNIFHTTKRNGIWKHNSDCQSFCKYYGVNYPFELEFNSGNNFQVNTLRNIEYYLESYRYASNCYDRVHILDHNFDKAVVYNSEQVSGELRLIHDDGRDPKFSQRYPNITPSYIEILFAKEEHKYRFNQFWDITKDRGEFSNLFELIWFTQANGYIKNLNPLNLNYSKLDTESKKFRHYNNQVLLIKEIVGNTEMIVSLALLKTLSSER